MKCNTLQLLTDLRVAVATTLTGGSLSHLVETIKKYDPNQSRDSIGRWTVMPGVESYRFDKDSNKWVSESGKPVPKDIQSRLAKLVEVEGLSRALTGVRVNPNAKDRGLLAIGWTVNRQTGEVGNMQSLYSWEHETRSYRAKFEALRSFHKVRAKLEAAAYRDALKGNGAAGAVLTMDRTAMRVGSVGSARSSGTYGASTLLARHVKVNGDTVRFTFPAKGGKPYDRSFRDQKLVAAIKRALLRPDGKTRKSADERLFDCSDNSVRAYMKKHGGKKAAEVGPHFFRYWRATAIAAAVIKKAGVPTLKRDAKRIRKEACERASEFLNNTPSMAYEKYIDPHVWTEWGSDVRPAPPKLTRPTRKSADEPFGQDELEAAMEDLFARVLIVGDSEGWEDEDLTGWLDGEDDEGTTEDQREKKFNPNQRRDSLGRWTTGGADDSTPRTATGYGVGEHSAEAARAEALLRESNEAFIALKTYVDNWRGKPVRPNFKTTDQMFTDEAGNYTPERRELHRLIVEWLLAGKTPQENPSFTLMGGGPAAGKGTVQNIGMAGDLSNVVRCDPDSIKEVLPEFHHYLSSGKRDPRVATVVHEESSMLNKRVRDEAMKRKLNVLLDATGDTSYESMSAAVEVARAAGRKVDAVYVTVPTELAVERSIKRFKETGRAVPESYLRKVHQHVSKLLPQGVSRGLFDSVKLYDMTESVEKGPALVMSAKGKNITIHDTTLWRTFLAKGKERLRHRKSAGFGLTVPAMQAIVMATVLGEPIPREAEGHEDEAVDLVTETLTLMAEDGEVFIPNEWPGE